MFIYNPKRSGECKNRLKEANESKKGVVFSTDKFGKCPNIINVGKLIETGDAPVTSKLSQDAIKKGACLPRELPETISRKGLFAESGEPGAAVSRWSEYNIGLTGTQLLRGFLDVFRR